VMQTVELKVGMSCQGCVGAVKRVLGKMEGSYSTLVTNISFPFCCFGYIHASGIDTPFYSSPM